MAVCDVMETPMIPLEDPPPLPTVHAKYSRFLDEHYFSEVNTMAFYRLGSPDTHIGGLINVGYNCYMNAVFQCLAYTPGFPQFCASLPNSIHAANDETPFFLKYFGDLVIDMRMSKSACPTFFLHDSWAISETFRRPIQQDAHEYLIKMLSVLDQECLKALEHKATQPDTLISHYFMGCQDITTICPHCSFSLTKQSKFNDLQIPVRMFTSTDEAIESLNSMQQLQDEEQCVHCGQMVKHMKGTTITRFPLVLIVTMLRFDNYLRKIDDFLSFPERLTFEDGTITYELYAMIIHEGRHISHGHFVALVRDANGTWYKADDVCVYRLKDEIVMGSCPYVLFYKQVV